MSESSPIRKVKLALRPPELAVKRVSGTSMKLNWKKVNGATGYEVYCSAQKAGSYKKIKTIGKGKTLKLTIKKLKKGKTYYFKVRAYRKTAGVIGYSPYSKTIKAKL